MKTIQKMRRIEVSESLFGSEGPTGPHMLQSSVFVYLAGSVQKFALVLQYDCVV